MRLTSLTLAAALLLNGYLTILPQSVEAQNKTLKGGVSETGRVEKNRGLSRTEDIDKKDPFSNEEDGEVLEAPKEMFKPIDVPKMPPKKPLSGNVHDQGQGMGMPQQPMMAPQNMPLDGTEDQMPQQPQQPAFNPNDPDSNPDMQLQWDMWHKRLAATIFQRYNFFAKAGFKRSPPLLCEVSYVVTRDGHINNINVYRKSPNILYNVLCYQAIKSLDGDLSVLTFPQGSRRMFVNKFGVFKQNYDGVGFRYTVGDKETIQGR